MRIVATLLLCASAANAESYLYWGKYLNSTMAAYPGSTDKYTSNRAGIRIEGNPFKHIDANDFNRMSCFVENECLIDGSQLFFSNPSSMNFKIGVKYTGTVIDVIYQHECRHAFEMRSDVSEQYDLVEFRYKILNKEE